MDEKLYKPLGHLRIRSNLQYFFGVFKETPRKLLGSGFEPLRISPTLLKSVSLGRARTT